jgi:hypothetical protein
MLKGLRRWLVNAANHFFLLGRKLFAITRALRSFALDLIVIVPFVIMGPAVSEFVTSKQGINTLQG